MSAQVTQLKKMPLLRYFSEVKAELSKVTWPSRHQTVSKTILVIVSSVAVGMYIGFLDFAFTHLATLILK
jgi:preprotein translocase subunit SecE